MELTLLFIFLCCLLKSYSRVITSGTKLVTTSNFKPTLKPTEDFNRINALDSIKEFDCIQDEDCTWIKNSSCISMKCNCKEGFININNECFKKRSLGDHCSYSEECPNDYSDCINNICSCKPKYRNIGKICIVDFLELCKDDCDWLPNSYCDEIYLKGCVCDYNHIFIEGKCHRKGVLNDDCSYTAQCQTDNTLCLKNKCSCKPGYLGIGNSHCIYENSVSLGGDCMESTQCKTLNSYCHQYGYCECRTGYARSGTICKIIYQITPAKKNSQMDTVMLIICIGSGVIAAVFIIILIFSVKKKLFEIQSRRTDNRNVPMQSGTATFNSNCSTTETTLEELDKPPSYEDVIRLSQSTNNLTSNEVLPEGSCPSYSESMKQRSRSSSM